MRTRINPEINNFLKFMSDSFNIIIAGFLGVRELRLALLLPLQAQPAYLQFVSADLLFRLAWHRPLSEATRLRPLTLPTERVHPRWAHCCTLQRSMSP